VGRAETRDARRERLCRDQAQDLRGARRGSARHSLQADRHVLALRWRRHDTYARPEMRDLRRGEAPAARLPCRDQRRTGVGELPGVRRRIVRELRRGGSRGGRASTEPSDPAGLAGWISATRRRGGERSGEHRCSR